MTISVITVTLNCASTLPALVASLQAQTRSDFEWIVVDGGSTDGTVDLLRNLEPGFGFRWISEPDFGIYHALNKGLAMAGGDYYLVIGADDELEPRAIGCYGRAVAGHEQAGGERPDIVSAPVWIDGALISPRAGLSWLRSGPPMVSAHSVGTLIRRDLHQSLGFYSRKFPIAADTHFLLKAAVSGCRFLHISEPVGRFGRDGVSGIDTLGALTESLRANIEVRGLLPLQLALFIPRVLRSYPRIARGAQRMRWRQKP